MDLRTIVGDVADLLARATAAGDRLAAAHGLGVRAPFLLLEQLIQRAQPMRGVGVQAPDVEEPDAQVLDEVAKRIIALLQQGDEAEAAALRILRRARPDFGFLAEESGASPSASEGRWILDPLGGEPERAEMHANAERPAQTDVRIDRLQIGRAHV